MISVTVNGKRQELENHVSLITFLESNQIPKNFTAVALNGVVLHRHEYEKVTLQEGDTLEIVRMVGGGSFQPSIGFIRGKETSAKGG